MNDGLVDVSQDGASFTEVLCFPPRPFSVSECPPATLIFVAALISRSWNVLQNKHCHCRIDKSFLPPNCPQHEQRCVVGSHRLIIRHSRPYFSDLPSKYVRNCRQPKSLIALDNLRFLVSPDTF